MNKQLGNILKSARKNKKLSVKDVSKYLIQKGFKASEKTVYSWENNNSEPTPDILLSLCELYEIQDILFTFGYKEEPDTDFIVSDSEMDLLIEMRSSNYKASDLARLVKYAKLLNEKGKDDIIRYTKLLSASNDYTEDDKDKEV